MNDFTVPAQDRSFCFRGERLGFCSSKEPGKQRWSEIAIYRTQGGKYIVAGVGRTTIAGETDRPWARICDDADCIVQRLRMSDAKGEGYLPATSRRALEEASIKDAAVADALLYQTID